MRARYYEPTAGRFLSNDPFPGFAANPIAENHSIYLCNNPAAKINPSGTSPALVAYPRSYSRSLTAAINRNPPCSAQQVRPESAESQLDLAGGCNAFRSRDLVIGDASSIPTAPAHQSFFRWLFQQAQDSND
jgi:hypothetical protein